MTTSSTEPRKSYDGDGSTTTLPITFSYNGASEIKVELITNSTGNVVLQTSPTDYSIVGSDVEMVTAPAVGETLVITLNVALDQQTNYVADGPFPAETHEAALDKLTRLVKQLKYDLDYNVLKLPTNLLTSTIITDTDIGASKIFRVNSANTGVELATVNAITNGGDSWSDAVDSNLVPDTDSTYNIGAVGTEFLNAYIDNIYGTLATAAQPNITSLGTLTALTVDNIVINGNDISSSSGDLTFSPTGVCDFSANTNHMVVPVGTTAQRDTSDGAGSLRFNLTDNKLEIYSGAAWTQLVGSGAPGSWSTPIDASLSFDTDSAYDIGTNAVRAANIYADSLYGLVSTAAQTSITSLGTLTALTVDNLVINGNDISSSSGDITFTPTGIVDITASTDHFLPPTGTTAQRTGATAGETRYNSSDNKLEYYNGTGWQQLTEGSTGGLVFLASVTASASATVDFDNYLDSTYETYLLIISNMVCATDGAVAWLRVGTGAGPTYQSGAAAYGWGGVYTGSGVAGTYDTSDSEIQINCTNGVGNAAGEQFNAQIYIYSPSDASSYTYTSSITSSTRNDSYTVVSNVAGKYLANTAVTSLRILMSSGNITSGEFKLYGVAKA